MGDGDVVGGMKCDAGVPRDDGLSTCMWGVACAGAGEASGSIWPNMIFAPPGGFPVTGLPFGRYPDAPVALIVSDCLRLCDGGPPARCAAPFMLLAATPLVGTAGGIPPRPFTGDPSDLPEGPDGTWRLGGLIAVPDAGPAAPGDGPPREADGD